MNKQNNEQQQTEEVNLLIFVIEAFASNNKLYRYIDKYYKRYKYEAYKQATESRFYNHNLIQCGTIEWEIYCKRILGLLELDKSEIIEDLIQKGWSSIYSYVKNQKELDLDKLAKKFYLPNQTDDEINAIVTIALMVANMYDKKLVDNHMSQIFLSQTKMRLSYYENGDLCKRFEYNNLSSEIKQKAKSIKHRIENKYLTIHSFMDVMDLQPLSNELRDYIDTELKILNSEGLDNYFNKEKISDRDVEEICALYYMHYKNQNINDAVKFLVSHLLLKIFAKEYMKVKQYYFKNNKETLYLNIRKREEQLKQLQENNKLLNNQINQLTTELEQYKKSQSNIEKQMLSQFAKEKEEYKTEIKKLNKTINDNNFNQQELEKLRNMMFSEKQVEEHNKININDSKILIVGGHDNLQSKIEECYNNIDCIDGFNTNEASNTNLLHYDYIIFYWGYMNHSVYNIIISYCRNHDKKFGYINTNNIDLLKNQIKNIICQNR